MQFIVENAGNTCYIDALIMGLFYQKEAHSTFLKTEVNNGMAIYLQEYIIHNFLNKVKNEKSVLTDDIMMLRELCIQNGWKIDTAEIYEQQDVAKFYSFLINLLKGQQVEIKRTSVCESMSENGIIERIPLIPLSFPNLKDIDTIKVSEMIHSWMYENYTKRTDFEDTKTVSSLNTYNITNIPTVLPFSINRFDSFGKRNDTKVIIQKKIVINIQYEQLEKHYWIFQSAICHRGDSVKSGHYYTLLNCNGKYYIFDDLSTPSMVAIDMANQKIVDIIKKECVLLIYRYLL